jgi:tetratricopeptide (TPR) repeat protein
LGRFKEAQESLDQAIRSHPDLATSYHNRALVAFGQAIPNLVQFNPTMRTTEAYKVLELGIADIQKALDLGAESAEVHHDAACLYALAARVENRWTAPAIRHLGVSVRLGFNPTNRNDVVFEPLQNETAYQALAELMTADHPDPQTQRILDPFKDLTPGATGD